MWLVPVAGEADIIRKSQMWGRDSTSQSLAASDFGPHGNFAGNSHQHIVVRVMQFFVRNRKKMPFSKIHKHLKPP